MTEPRSPRPDQIPDLFSQPADDGAGRPTITDRFLAFHADNPGFYRNLVRFARELRAETGAERIGIQALIERARWDHLLVTRSLDFKVNNDYAAFYARLLMQQEPDLAGAFETRKAPEADTWAASLPSAA